MWIAIVFVVAFLLMAALMPKPNVENARAAKLGDFQFPRSKYGDPMPLVWGTVRQKSPITAWFGDFRPVPIRKKMKTGLFSSKKVTVGYKNYLGIDCILCLGPGVRLRKFWAGTYLVWEGNLTSSGDIYINKPNLFGGEDERGGLQGTISFYDGRFDPPQDSYLVSKIGPNVPAYNGFARALFKAFYIGTGTTPEPFSFEIQRITSGLHATYSIMPNGLDVNPMEIVYDAMTQKWGRFGNLESEIDMPSFTACAQTLYNEGLGMSLIVQSAITGKDLLEEVMRVADGVLYQDPATAKIVAKLVRQDYTISELLVLDESSVKELRNFQKTTWENTFNQCRVTFKNRASSYDDSVAITQDFANINFQNRVKSTEVSTPGVTDATVASKIAARQLSILNVPLYKCDLTVNRKAQNLRPGSVFVLNWSPFGISNMVMRVTKIDFGELTSNQIKLSCVQDRFSSSTLTFAPPEGSGWTPISTEPTPVTTRLLFTPPAFLTSNSENETLSNFDNYGRLYLAAVAPGSTSISYDAMTAPDNFSSSPILSLESAPYNGGGVLLNAYASTVASETRNDTSGSLVVTGVSQASIEGLQQYTTLDQARDGSAFLLINNELFVYVGFVDNGGGQVTFPNVYRGVLDTVPGNHAANDRVWFISGTDGLLPELVSVGTTRYVKLLDTTSGGKLDISLAPSFSGSLTNRAGLPLPPQYLTLAGSRTPSPQVGATSIVAEWRNRSRADTLLRVYHDTANTREAGTETRVRWRVGGGAYTTVTTAGSSTTLDVTGKYGTLEVIVDSFITSNSKYSTYSDSLTMTLTAPPPP
ncbi:central tail hub [Pseudomonas phage vB_PaeS_SCUT-S4]|nr:central tail hub [Pseudomonas phage vB_PaeS_SCUT-S4]